MRVIRVTADLTVPELDEATAFYVEAQRRGHEILYPLTTEAWGIRRFFVRAPGGAALNVAQHHDPEGVRLRPRRRP